MIRSDLQLWADRFSDRKTGHPDQSAAQTLSGAITGDSIMKRIPLTQGKFALVDDTAFDWLNQWKWYARECGKEKWYAARKKSIKSKQHTIYMHRFVMNALPVLEIDHVNGNGLDNRIKNLRICQRQSNKWNTSKQKRKTSSKYKGVCWHKINQNWWAYIYFNNNCISLGYYDNETEAAKAYNTKAKELFGEFARLNNVNL